MADARTADDIRTDLARVRSALAALEADPDGKLTDYTHAGRQFGKTDRYKLLMEREARLQEELTNFPCAEEITFDDPDLND